MAILQCRIDKDDGKMFSLCDWNTGSFEVDPVLSLNTDDLSGVKAVFAEIECVEIFRNDGLIATYSIYDGYSDISYIGPVFIEGEGRFGDCLKVRLKKTNLAEEVERIKNIVEPVIDEDNMSIDELKARRVKQISDAGAEMIYAGTQVTLSNGQTKSYKYTVHDQLDLDTYFNLFLVLPEDTDYVNTFVSWHATDEICQDYSVLDIMLIFFALKQHLFYYKTYTNVLKTCVINMSDIEDVRDAQFGMPLPPEYQASMDATMQSELATIMAIKEKFFPTPEPGPDVEPDEPDEPTPDTDETDEPTEPDDTNENEVNDDEEAD